ncbi:SH3 domain-containing protein [Embleya sp. NPDC050154]|uniref:SH3 domain-containing protein n=1 Tax=unclassified Embleya TaxID=2699296 RepID=UPI00379AE6FB
MSKLGRSAAAVVASVSLFTGVGVALAPSASAASHPACYRDLSDHTAKITGNNVSLRKAKGTWNPILRVLQKGAKVTVYCQGVVYRDGDAEASEWYYVKHQASGIKGWVSIKYVR